MTTATFYHAGCSVCVSAEEVLVAAINPAEYAIEKIHLGEQRQHLQKAKQQGVKTIPALVIDGNVFHINHGADITDLE